MTVPKSVFEFEMLNVALGLPSVYEQLNSMFTKPIELPKVEPGTDPNLLIVPTHMLSNKQNKRSNRRKKF